MGLLDGVVVIMKGITMVILMYTTDDDRLEMDLLLSLVPRRRAYDCMDYID